MPWAGAGQVTIANGGDIAKEMGWFDPAWLTPEGVPGMPQPTPAPTQESVWEPLSLVVSAKQPGTLFLLQFRQHNTGRDQRLMMTYNEGQSWEPVIDGTLPTDCIEGITMDYNTPNELYVLGCFGLYHWNGGRWVEKSNVGYTGYVIQYGNPQTRWALRNVGSDQRELVRTDDGGNTWRRLASVGRGTRALGVDSSTHRTLYAIEYRQYTPSTLARMDSSQENNRIDISVGEPYMRPTGFTINGSNGDMYYLVAGNGSTPTRIWYASNADEPDIKRIQWEVRYETYDYIDAIASGTDGSGRFALYMVRTNGIELDELIQSLDEGRTWQVIQTPR